MAFGVGFRKEKEESITDFMNEKLKSTKQRKL
jgi:hypothetical protein